MVLNYNLEMPVHTLTKPTVVGHRLVKLKSESASEQSAISKMQSETEGRSVTESCGSAESTADTVGEAISSAQSDAAMNAESASKRQRLRHGRRLRHYKHAFGRHKFIRHPDRHWGRGRAERTVQPVQHDRLGFVTRAQFLQLEAGEARQRREPLPAQRVKASLTPQARRDRWGAHTRSARRAPKANRKRSNRCMKIAPHPCTAWRTCAIWQGKSSATSPPAEQQLAS